MLSRGPERREDVHEGTQGQDATGEDGQRDEQESERDEDGSDRTLERHVGELPGQVEGAVQEVGEEGHIVRLHARYLVLWPEIDVLDSRAVVLGRRLVGTQILYSVMWFIGLAHATESGRIPAE